MITTLVLVGQVPRHPSAPVSSMSFTSAAASIRRCSSGSISATSEALYVHPNTLRQRLRRIAELTDLDLRTDDWLMIEIAVKLVLLRLASGMDTSGA